MESILMGLGLSSSSGFKPFIPLFIISLAGKLGYIELASHSEWIGSYTFMAIMVILTILEFLSASIPFLGRVFDLAGVPIAIITGYIALASVTGTLGDNNFLVKQGISLLLGGGLAAVVKSFNTVKNALLDTFTFGFWGPANSGLDVIKSIILSILSMFAPILVLIIVVALLFVTYVTIKRFKKSRQPS